MKAILTLDDELLRTAQELSGLEDASAVVSAGLEALIERERAHRLAALGGSDVDAAAGRRRRSS